MIVRPAATRFEVIRRAADGVEVVEADTDRAFGRHVHEHFGIGLILRGAQRSASGRGAVEAAAGDLITVNPGEVHDGIPLGGQGRHWRMLYFDPPRITAAFEDMAADAGLPACEFAHPVVRDARAAGLFRAVYAAMAGDGGADDASRAEEALPLLLQHLLERQRPALRPCLARMAHARAMIDDDPSAPLSLAMLAREAGLSRFQFVRGFARHTGLTPHAYLLQRRIHRARGLIAAGTPLAQAAAASGFADQSHMTRLFVRCFGFSPGAYAKKTG